MMLFSSQQFNIEDKGFFEEIITTFRNSEKDLSSVNSLCSFVCDSSVSLINFLDDSTQYTVSCSGEWKYPQLPADQSICRYALSSGKMLIINNTSKDPRTKYLPYVADKSILFYAGIPIPNKRGKSFGTICVFDDKPRDLTDNQKKSLQIIAEQLQYRIEFIIQKKDYSNILKILEEKDTLFYEIHHRIKNNLADICGMLQIEWFESEDHVVRDILTKAESRIIAVIKLHEILYESDELTQTNLQRYLDLLTRTIIKTSARDGLTMSYELNVDDITLSMNQSLSVGLILNELISNANRHAFQGRNSGTLLIAATEDDRGIIHLEFSDDGIGMDLGDKNLTDFGNLGLKLVDLLVQQLNGEIIIENTMGTAFRLTFVNENKLSEDETLEFG